MTGAWPSSPLRIWLLAYDVHKHVTMVYVLMGARLFRPTVKVVMYSTCPHQPRVVLPVLFILTMTHAAAPCLLVCFISFDFQFDAY